MKRCAVLTLVVLGLGPAALSQRTFETHIRGMLRQTVYNTGELGRALEGANSTVVGIEEGRSSLEWPPNSRMTLDGRLYYGQHNSQGSGLVLRAKVNGTYESRACGGITDGSGNETTIAGVYVLPGTITRTENYPVLSDGSLNSSFNPDEAEEIIVTEYETVPPMRLFITQTSRAWSYPGYDAMIITEYDIVNQDTIDYTDGFVMSQNAFSPSAFGLMRKYGVWNESSTTSRSREEYARYNYSRLMTYVHSRDGFPDVNTTTGIPYSDQWSTPGNRGGLDSPQAIGVLPLHYDYDHLQLRNQTTYLVGDSVRVWDANGKFKQPYSTETNGNRNQEMNRTIALGLDITVHNPQAINSVNINNSSFSDSAYWTQFHKPYGVAPFPGASVDPVANREFRYYWHGRMKPRASSVSGYTGAFFHYMSFGPYIFKKAEHLKFTVAHVVGYGPGVATDSVWRDAGGANSSTTGFFLPVPSWYDTLTYPNLSAIAGITSMGSPYLQVHELPWFVTAGKGISAVDTAKVISIRDAADRAIQMYTGRPLVKYDGVQFKPESTAAAGSYCTTYIPFPAPIVQAVDGKDSKNRVVWGPQVEGFKSLPTVQAAVVSGRIRSGLMCFLVMKSPDGLGPWTVLDSVATGDSRYYNVDPDYPDQYVFRDTASNLNETYYYCVVSVDSLGGKSGMTNMLSHLTGTLAGVDAHPLPPVSYSLEQNYPNPFNPSTTMRFGLPHKSNVSLTVFNTLGQQVATLVEGDQEAGYHEVRFEGTGLSSGVYFYRLTAGDYVQTRKLLLLR